MLPRNLVVAIVVATGALVAAGVVGLAGAETTTTTAATPALTVAVPPRTVSVQGVASQPLEPTASAAAATAVYRQGMAAAIEDGHAKAQFLAEKTATTLGAVQSVGEGGGYISCPEGLEYQGGQPDFGSGAPAVFGAASAPAASTRPVPAVRKPVARHHKRRHVAKKAAAETCTLSTQIALVYQLS